MSDIKNMKYDTKLIIFDLDGVLIDSREQHYDALNRSLREIDEKYVIQREEHLSKYDGLPTRSKLQLLTDEKGLPKSKHNNVWRWKQHYTVEALQGIQKNQYLIEMMKDIRKKGWKISCCSNAVSETTHTALKSLGIFEYMDGMFCADVSPPKPYPEMYWKAMMNAHAKPSNTIIIEDSHIGREGAIESGAHLLPVKNPNDLTKEKVYAKMADIIEKPNPNIPWKDNKLNVLIPMAGLGSRFSDAGYTFPKPLIEVNGKTMIETVVRNLNMNANFIFIVQKQHYDYYNLSHFLNAIKPGCQIVITDEVTEGAACTTLLAKELINTENPLVIANSDQYIEWNSNEAMYAFEADGVDGGILTFKANHPKWSYAKTDSVGFVSEVAEKKVISEDATVGVYYWKRGSDYVKYAEQMIEKNVRVNNEFYVCPVFNEAIADGQKIRVKTIDRMWGIGDPESLKYFLENRKQ